MNLIERIQSLTQRANRYESSEKNIDESRNLQVRFSEVESKEVKLQAALRQMRLFREEGLAPEVDESNFQSSQKSLQIILSRFVKERTAQSLTRGRDWNKLTTSLDESCSNMEKNFKDSWREFVNSAYGGDKPEDLQGSLAQTDANNNVLKQYKEQFKLLQELSRKLTVEKSDFDNVRQIAKKLTDLNGLFDRDVPDSVNKFLQAVASGGAPLNLLTEEVRHWLQEQNSSDQYRIKKTFS